MKITWLTQGGFLFEGGGIRLVVDPYMSDCLAAKGLTRLVPFPWSLAELRPDCCCCTHDHLDHFDPETVVAVARQYPACRFAGPENSYRHFLRLGLDPARVNRLEIGTPCRCQNLTLLPVFAAHSDASGVGLVVEADGSRVYLTGDTRFEEGLFSDATRHCDVVLICINGQKNNMNGAEAAAVVARLRPRLALPMHYGLFAENTVSPEPFIAACRQMGVASFAMRPGVGFPVDCSSSQHPAKEERP